MPKSDEEAEAVATIEAKGLHCGACGKVARKLFWLMDRVLHDGLRRCPGCHKKRLAVLRQYGPTPHTVV